VLPYYHGDRRELWEKPFNRSLIKYQPATPRLLSEGFACFSQRHLEGNQTWPILFLINAYDKISVRASRLSTIVSFVLFYCVMYIFPLTNIFIILYATATIEQTPVQPTWEKWQKFSQVLVWKLALSLQLVLHNTETLGSGSHNAICSQRKTFEKRNVPTTKLNWLFSKTYFVKHGGYYK